jgi:hypothetical protein
MSRDKILEILSQAHAALLPEIDFSAAVYADPNAEVRGKLLDVIQALSAEWFPREPADAP